MKNFGTTALKTLLAVLASALAVRADLNGLTSIRYSVDSTMTATRTDVVASGRVQAFLKRVGSSDHHRLRINAAGLAPKANYTVLMQIGDNPDFVAVTNFTSSRRGSGRVVYLNSTARAGVASKRVLPAVLSPVSIVRGVAIADADGNIVLATDLHTSESMKFQIASVFENAGTDAAAIGCVALACQGGGVQFRLFAAGSGSQFTLCVNGAPVETYPADATGHISIGVFPETAPSPFDFLNLSLRNSADEVVLQSDLR